MLPQSPITGRFSSQLAVHVAKGCSRPSLSPQTMTIPGPRIKRKSYELCADEADRTLRKAATEKKSKKKAKERKAIALERVRSERDAALKERDAVLKERGALIIDRDALRGEIVALGELKEFMLIPHDLE